MTNHMEGLLGGRYRIIKELARGGFGITYLAEDTLSPNSPCVIKKLYPRNLDIIETAKLLFKREVAILKYLQQKQQIPKYFNYFEESENYYLVQEYIQGKTLYDLLYEPWTKPRVINFLREILSVLKYLHQIKVIHRDIKPSNVMRRDEDKKFVLIDFGAVKQLDLNYSYTQQPPHTMVGSPGYSAPEQMAGRPGFNSDIYALGITAIHLLTKVHPRDLKRDEKDNIVWQEGVDIDDSLAAILTKMVYCNPEQRYEFVEDVITDLSNLIAVSEEDFIKNLYKGATVSQNQSSNNWSETENGKRSHVTNNNLISQKTIFSNKKRPATFPGIKLWQILIVLTALGAIAVFIEFTHPFLRPLYYSHQGNNLLDARKPEKALEEFQNLIALKPDSAEAWRGRGDALFSSSSQRYAGALQAYNKALSLKPYDIKTLINKARILDKLRQYKEALETYQQVLKIEPQNTAALSGMGRAYIGLQDNHKALEFFKKAQTIKPDDPTVWLEEGNAIESSDAKAAQDSYQEALRTYDEIVEKDQQNAILWSDRGNVLLKLNLPQDALGSYEKALKIDKNFYEALLGKGNALSSLKKYPDALSAFTQASLVRPDDYLAWLDRGTLLAQNLANHEEAIKSFDNVIKLRKDFFPAWLFKGVSLSELKRYNEAMVALDQAKKLEPKNADVWVIRGDVLTEMRDNKEACKSYESAIKLQFPPEQLKSLKQVCGK